MSSKIRAGGEPTTLTNNLQSLLIAKRMSQGTLADAAGLTRTTVSGIMHGADLKLSTLTRLAAALDTDVPSLLTPPPADPATAPTHRAELQRALAILMAEMLNK